MPVSPSNDPGNRSRIFHRNPAIALPVAVRGEGVHLVDRDGKRYIDASGGAAVSCLGHGHPRVIAAIKRQVDEIAYAHTSFFTTEVAEDLADRLVADAPEGLSHVYLVSGGSEAMEAALKLARQYFVEIGQPARHKFIARRQSYHGNTLGALAIGGNAWRREPFLPLLAPAIHVSPCYAYRDQRPGETEDAYSSRLATELDGAILAAGPGTVAAFVAETVVGATMGAVPPTRGYLAGIKAVCERHGVLLILDEVMCGMGRTGHLHACSEDGVAPDLLTIAKGLGGGYQPIGATLVSGRIYDAVVDGSGFFQHGHTYIGHATACAAALAVQEAIAEDGLLANVLARGEQLRAELRSVFSECPQVGDIRGRGLFAGVELVADRASKAPFDPQLKIHARIKATAKDLGLLVYPMGGDDRRPVWRPRPAGASVHRDAGRHLGDRGPTPRRRPGRGPGVTADLGPLAIAVAINGARRTKADHPALPMTVPEIARDAALCAEAGAALLHLHVRDGKGRHSLDAGLYRDATAAIRREAGPDIVVQASTEAVGQYGTAQQMALVRALRPEAVSLALGEIVPDGAAEAEAASFYREIVDAGIGVQHILYSASDVLRLRDYGTRGIVPEPRPHALFVLGRYTAGQQSDPFALLAFLEAWPRDWPWSVCAFGQAEMASMALAAGLGGHARVGFENSIVRPDGTAASSNLDAVSAVVTLARTLARPIASPGEARRIYRCGGS